MDKGKQEAIYYLTIWIMIPFVIWVTIWVVTLLNDDMLLNFLFVIIINLCGFLVAGIVKKVNGRQAIKSKRSALQKIFIIIIKSGLVSFGIIALLVGFLRDSPHVILYQGNWFVDQDYLIQYMIVYAIIYLILVLTTGILVNTG